MKISQIKISAKLNLILTLFILTVAAGAVYVISRFSLSVIFQQVSSFIAILVVWITVVLAVKQVFRNYFSKPLQKLAGISDAASRGDISRTVDYKNEDEIGRISEALDKIIQNKRELAEFSERIGDGDFNAVYTPLSDDDKLGYSITGMRDKLQKVVAEDTRSNWISEGLAKFGEILRSESGDFSAICDNVLTNLVKYMQANQGAIFLMNDHDKEKSSLEMTAAYAWGRKKHLTRVVEAGEGLVGQCLIEKDTIYITDVPENYISITSGLGDANPRSILIVPMVFNDEIQGIFELASFTELEKYQIEFVEKLGEIMASTLNTVKINDRTQQLLRESQKLTEEMRAQEEELRQNLEEMNATQEEMQMREVEKIGIFTAINNTLATAEFSLEGKLIVANEKFLEMMNYSLDEVENMPDRKFLDKSNIPIEEYNKFWEELRQGKLQQGDYKRITKSGREIWINASYTPALDKDGKPYKVIQLAQDITEKKKTEFETNRQAEELRVQGDKLQRYTEELEDIKKNLSEKLEEASKDLKQQIKDIEEQKAKNIAVLEGCVDGVISFNQNGIIEYFNKAAEEIWGIKRDEVLGNKIDTLIPVTLEEKNNAFAVNFSNNGSSKELDVRTEVSLKDRADNELDLLMTLTKVKVEEENTFTIFAQKISVDLF